MVSKSNGLCSLLPSRVGRRDCSRIIHQEPGSVDGLTAHVCMCSMHMHMHMCMYCNWKGPHRTAGLQRGLPRRTCGVQHGTPTTSGRPRTAVRPRAGHTRTQDSRGNPLTDHTCTHFFRGTRSSDGASSGHQRSKPWRLVGVIGISTAAVIGMYVTSLATSTAFLSDAHSNRVTRAT